MANTEEDIADFSQLIVKMYETQKEQDIALKAFDLAMKELSFTLTRGGSDEDIEVARQKVVSSVEAVMDIKIKSFKHWSGVEREFLKKYGSHQ